MTHPAGPVLSTRITVRVRYAETDAMGVTYHGAYFPYFEAARVQLLDDIGHPYREIESQGFFLPVLEAQVQWLQPARFDDRLIVTAEIREMPGVRLTVHYTICRDTVTLTTGHTRHAFINAEGRPVKPPAELLSAFRQYFNPNVS